MVYGCHNCDGCYNQLQIQRQRYRLQRIQDHTYRTVPIRAALVYPPLQQTFENALLDYVARNTRLQVNDGMSDLNLEGEITGYSLSPQAVTENAIASKTRLTITVRIRYTDSKNDKKQRRPIIFGLSGLRFQRDADRRAGTTLPGDYRPAYRTDIQRHSRQLVKKTIPSYGILTS